MREKGSAKSRTINEGAVATPSKKKGIAKSRTINVHSCPMYRHLLGLLCGLDSFVTSRIPVFSKRIDFFKVGIDNELLDPLFSFEEVSEEAEPLASDVDQGLHAGNDKEEANRILDAGRDLDVSSNEAELTGGQDNLNHVIEPATEENMEKETTEGLTEMDNGSEHVKEDIPADFESRRREIQNAMTPVRRSSRIRNQYASR
ncbi:unnamed protein product [Musa acuminata subsp. burmannicoides]